MQPTSHAAHRAAPANAAAVPTCGAGATRWAVSAFTASAAQASAESTTVAITQQFPLHNNWKILFKVGSREDKKTKALEDKIKIFNTNEYFQKISYSYDVYSEKENFITLHGIRSKINADDIVLFLKETAKNKITESAIIISGENYKVIQIKKNLETYLALEKK